MKLFIRRNQEEKRGMLGGYKGMSFLLTARLELTADEKALIEKYKQWDTVVHSYESDNGVPVDWTLRSMISGRSVSCDGVVPLIESEDNIKNSCNNLKILLEVMDTFGGEQIIEFNSANNKKTINIPPKKLEDDILTFCYHCGEELPASVIACPKCGKEI